MIYLLWILMLITVAILVTGFIVFIRGGEVNRKYGNKLMQFRIIFQFLALIVALAFIAMVQAGG